jgi:5-(carboxyamino)imidazole ribonucleotide mutase
MKVEVIIIAGSKSDKAFIGKIKAELKKKNLNFKTYYASAHKKPEKVLKVLSKFKNKKDKVVFITAAGRSNALSGFVAANCNFPVIACPPFKDKLDYLVNIHSSLQMPSKVPVLTIIDPENACLAAARILAFKKINKTKK